MIIVNHALLLSNMNNPGLLPEYETVIIDEAHNLVDVAYDQLTLEVNMFKVNAILDIIDPKTTSAKRWTQKIEMLFDDNPEIKMHYKALQTGCETSRKNGLEFFNDLANSITD